MNIVLFKEITTDEALTKLEEEGKKYEGLYVDMDEAKERKYVKDNALLINDLIKKVDRARIDKAKDYKIEIEAEARSITERLQEANKPFTLLIDAHKEKRAKELAAEKAIADAKALAIKIEADHNEAIMIDRIRTIDLAEAEKVRQENEARIKAEAAAEAKIQAELAAKKAIDDAEQARIDAIKREEEAKEREAESERRRITQEKQAELDRIEEARQAVIRAEQQAAKAVEDEKKRVAEAARIEAEEQAKKERNRAHVGQVRGAAKDSLMAIGIDEELAKKIVLAIHKGEITNISIKY